jgi:gluconolactonase
MKFAVAAVCASGLLGSTLISSQTGAAAHAASEMTSPAIPGVVAGGTKVQVVASGIHGGEGPIATPDGGLLFCEKDAVPPATNKILKIDKEGKLSVYRENPHRLTGLAYDRAGRLIGLGSEPPQVVVVAPTPSVLVSTFEHEPLIRPNDLVFDRKGGLYFTDPFPLPDKIPAPKNPTPLPPGRKPAVFYLKPDGHLMKVTDAVPRPNGIQLSPDGTVLYVANQHPTGEFVLAFDVRPDGSVGEPRNFARLEGPRTDAGTVAGGADGLTVDADGRLYAGTPIGVQVFSPGGQALGIIRFPTKAVNLAFAGPDRRTLYVVSSEAVYAIRMLATGIEGRGK